MKKLDSLERLGAEGGEPAWSLQMAASPLPWHAFRTLRSERREAGETKQLAIRVEDVELLGSLLRGGKCVTPQRGARLRAARKYAQRQHWTCADTRVPRVPRCSTCGMAERCPIKTCLSHGREGHKMCTRRGARAHAALHPDGHQVRQRHADGGVGAGGSRRELEGAGGSCREQGARRTRSRMNQ